MLIARIEENRYIFDVPDVLRTTVLDLATQLDAELDGDNDAVKRLFPTAYPDDPDKEAGYQILARSELIDTRHSAIDTVRSSAKEVEVDGETIDAWMRVVNDLRLVIGTQLDMGEEQDWQPPPEQEVSHAVYRWLSYLLQAILEARMGEDDLDYLEDL
jgi:hypothetical protein